MFFYFLVKIFMIFRFFMQRFCAVNSVLVENYTRVKHNQKSAMTAKKSHFHDLPFFMQRFCPVYKILIANYTSVKHNPKSAMTAGKLQVFVSVKIFMNFLFYATFLPSRSRFHRKLCKRKTQS